MAAREFLCEIRNVGEGPLTRVRDQLEFGSWTDGLLPSQSAQIVNPGEAKRFQSESDGILTGTRGSVTYSGLTSDSTLEFLKISWSVPFLATDTPSLVIERARFDPDTDRNSFEWQNRDQRPSSLTVQEYDSDPGDENFLDQLKDVPNDVFLLPFLFRPHEFVTLHVGGTSAGDSLKFPTTPTPPTVSSPLKGSAVPLWVGNWVSENLMAVITSAERNTVGGQWGVMVSVAEKGANGPQWFPSQHVPITQPNVAPPHHGPGGIPTEEVHVGDYVTLGGDASLEINEIRANNVVVGHCLFYRRPTKPGINPMIGPHFAEMMFTQIHIA
jgi:hypothetical protein